MTSLYNACVEKDSTPSSRTISAIVTAVQNISTGIDEETYNRLINMSLALFEWKTKGDTICISGINGNGIKSGNITDLYVPDIYMGKNVYLN